MNISCVDLVTLEMQFVRNLDFDERQGTEIGIPVKIEPVYGVNENPGAENSRLILQFEVGELNSKVHPFYCKIVLAGIYDWCGLSEEEAEDEIMTKGAEQIMAFVNSYFHELLLKAGLKPIVLEPMKFDEWASDEKASAE